MDSSPFFPQQAVLDVPGIVLAAGSRRLDDQDLAAMCRSLPAGSDGAALQSTDAGLVVHRGDSHREDGLMVACLGAPHWCDGSAGDADAAQIAQAYRIHDAAVLERLGGPFALVIVDAEAGLVLCAVDRFAREPLFWQGDGNGLVLGSSADAVLAHPTVTRELSHQGLFHYLFFHMVPGPDSVYAGLHKLPAAHCLHWQAGKLEVRPYWLPAFDEHGADRDALRAGVLDSLRGAVARDAGGDECGAFLSGGLDSSTVAGLLAGVRPGADTYSIGFDAAGYDEIAYARIATGHFGNRGHEYYVRPDDVLAALPSVAAAYDEPFGNSSALPALFCAALARADGKRRLLAGDGGDELYAGNARYAKQQVFEVFGRLPGFVQGLLRLATSPLPDGVPLLGKVKSYVAQASVPLPDRLQTYNYVYRLGVAAMFEDDFAASIDATLPYRLERDIYRRPAHASTLNRMLYLDWQHTLADNDLRKVGRMCTLADIEVRYPMLDEAVVAHSLRVPSRLKLPSGKLRDFYKQSVQGFLPPAIIDKPKHGFGLPFGVWMADHPGLREMAGDNLARLRRRGILRPDFIDRALHLHRESHAAYYGELVWVMMMLELWLTSRGFEP